ncbi:hypothetical protein F7P07_28280 (plasmid) [Klebsiella pneumoniae]|nr:hypothetical protein F7P07_28280 [Klebsiella pneumoniae]
MKPVMTRVDGCFTVFGRIGVMPGKTGSNQKRKEAEKGDALREFLPVHPCNPVSFHAAQCSY